MTIRVLPPPGGNRNAVTVFGRTYVAPGAGPVLASATPSGSGGTLATATYWYKLTALGPWGESLPSNELSAAVTGPTGSVALVWGGVLGATGYRVYRGTTTGGENVFYAPGNVTSFTDTGAGNTGGTPNVNATVDMPDDDARIAGANGWLRVANGVGATTARPAWTLDQDGFTFLDTTLGFIIVWDGQSWRNPLTGAVV